MSRSVTSTSPDAEDKRIYYAMDRAEGICVECHHPAVPGMSRCQEHRERQNRRAMERVIARRGPATRIRVCRACSGTGHDHRTCRTEGVRIPRTEWSGAGNR